MVLIADHSLILSFPLSRDISSGDDHHDVESHRVRHKISFISAIAAPTTVISPVIATRQRTGSASDRETNADTCDTCTQYILQPAPSGTMDMDALPRDPPRLLGSGHGRRSDRFPYPCVRSRSGGPRCVTAASDGNAPADPPGPGPARSPWPDLVTHCSARSTCGTYAREVVLHLAGFPAPLSPMLPYAVDRGNVRADWV